MAKYIILGSFSRILFGECIIQNVEIIKNKTKGTKGRIASGNVRIFPVLSLYDLQNNSKDNYINVKLFIQTLF